MQVFQKSSYIGDCLCDGLFQLQMRVSFPFLRAKYLYTSLLIMRNRSF